VQSRPGVGTDLRTLGSWGVGENGYYEDSSLSAWLWSKPLAIATLTQTQPILPEVRELCQAVEAVN
jgi:hypothetical protein